MLGLECITKSFGDRVLFSDIDLFIDNGDKIGVIAPNGSGKTTLLKIIMGYEPYDNGIITKSNGLKISYLEQLPQLPKGISILDAVMDKDNDVCNTIKLYEKAVLDNDNNLISELSEKMDRHDAWSYDIKLKKMLSSMGISDVYSTTDNLSGGEVKRIALANALMNEPDIFLFDEPTNHLDLQTIEWLEDYLSTSNTTLLMITHDRYFLDNVCNSIIELDNGSLYRYKGNYKYYIEKRNERILASESQLDKAYNLFNKEKEWINRQPQARGTKARYRIEAFEELKKKIKEGGKKNNRLQISSDEMMYMGKKVIDIENISLSFSDRQLIKDFTYTFARKEKIGIVGKNGVGKTSFIRLLMGELKPDNGKIDVGQTVRFGYYSQEMPSFDINKRVIDILTDIADNFVVDGNSITPTQLLSKFLFPPSMQYTPIYKLSGGELKRLYLCTVLIQNPNFLILDEPTNDLDILTINVLEEYLVNFDGCVLIVSHDRYFMDKIVDHIFAFQGNGVIKDFPGNYSLYREYEKYNEENISKTSDSKIKEDYKKDNVRTKKKLSYKEQKELDEIKEQISIWEKEKTDLEMKMSLGTMSLEELNISAMRVKELIDIIDEKTLRWLELEE